jgi:hypothetical protein
LCNRWFTLVLVAACLCGCAATVQQVADKLNQKYDGANADQMTLAFGPPRSVFKMNNGSSLYEWQVGGQAMNVDAGRYGGTADTFRCLVRATVAPNGIVSNVTTSDAANMGGESLCATRMGLVRQ